MTRPVILPPGVLRKCIECGREALTKEDLEFFMKQRTAPHGRANLCKKCRNQRTRLKSPGLSS